MKDFNFFQMDSYSEKKDKDRLYYGLAILIFVIFFTGLTYGIKYMKISRLNKDIKVMEDFLNSNENNAKLKTVEIEDKKISILNKYDKKVSHVSQYISDSSRVNSEVIRAISSAVPKDVYFKSMNIESNNIQIQAQASSRENIAEFQNNLRKLEFFKNVHVANISETEGQKYIFNLKCSLKDVDKYENK